MVIAHNLLAMYADRQNKISNGKLRASSEKLASGFRINRAADDAAGLTISETMRMQIRGLNQASRNVEDGVSYTQVADGALSEVQSMLQRMRELSVQSVNDTNSLNDRQAMDDEFQQLKQEMSHVFKDTQFNTKKIWDENGNDRVQIGVEQVPAVKPLPNYRSDILTNTNKEAIPSNYSFQLNADVNGITATWKGFNGKDYTSSLIEWPATLAGMHSFQLSDYITPSYLASNPELSGIDFSYSYNVADAATLNDVIQSLNHVNISCYPYNTVNTTIYTEDGSTPDAFFNSTQIEYPALLASNKNFDAYDDLFIEGSVGGIADQDNLIQDPTDTDSSSKWIYQFNMPGIGSVKAVSNSTYYYSNWQDPGKKWWDYNSIGQPYALIFSPTPPDGSLDSVVASLENDTLDLVNDTIGDGYILVGFSLNADTPYTVGDSSFTSVGSRSMMIHVKPDDTVDTIKAKLQKLSGTDIFAGDFTTNTPSYTYYQSVSNYANEVTIDSPIYQSRLNIEIQAGANSGETISLTYDSLNLQNIGVYNATVLTREDAENAITSVSNSIDIVSDQRSLFGAYQNRLEHTQKNVNNEAENASMAESKIRDTDMSLEIVQYSKEQILQQVTQSLLAQSNAMTQSVLSILK